jgi:hypothetical protein
METKKEYTTPEIEVFELDKQSQLLAATGPAAAPNAPLWDDEID